MTREMINVINNWTLDEEPRSDISKKSVGGSASRRLTGFYGHEYFAAMYLQRRLSGWLAKQRRLDKKKTKETGRKVKKAIKKLRKIKKKHSGNLVLAAVREGPSASFEAIRQPSQQVECVEQFIHDEVRRVCMSTVFEYFCCFCCWGVESAIVFLVMEFGIKASPVL
ncbi:hypothetical protein PF010_g32324 [Phytophthora fragariae]|uniref:Uncharacterized protein n=3 Tax=Phytophthora fragariae TaxID=53985 RepID=A0A6G0JFB1_9STRA|nr:hypothetical protein PF010_g32324 [Phytophthora fragariae]